MEINVFEKYPNFMQYLIDNKIHNLEELTYSDVLLGAKENELTAVISLYLDIRRSFNNVCVNECKINSVFDDKINNIYPKICKLRDIVSIWDQSNLNLKDINLKHIVSLIISYLSYNDISKETEKEFDGYLNGKGVNVNSKIKTVIRGNITLNFDKIIIFNSFIRCKEISRGKINYYQYKKLISIRNENNYINSFISVKAYNYLENRGIRTFGDLYNDLTLEDFNKLYFNLVNTIPILIETNNKNIPCDYIIESMINKNSAFDDLIIANMKIKGMKDCDIGKSKNITYKEILKSYYKILNLMKCFFDLYDGRYFIMYLLTLENGYISMGYLQRILPKYYALIKDVVTKDLVYNIYYDSNYNIITNRDIKGKCAKREKEILEKYHYNIDDEEYNALYLEICDNLRNNGLNLPCDVVHKRLQLIYKNKGKVYSRGYVSSEYKVMKIYEQYYSKGIPLREMNLFQEKYNMWFEDEDNIYEKKTHYFVKDNEKYILKNSILKKYNVFRVNVDLMCILRICESMKCIFNINDVSRESGFDIKYIRKILSKSKLYYQLSFNTFIKSDYLHVENELMSLFIKYKDESSDVIYSKINDSYKIFLKNYKIKNKIYLKRIVRNVVSKKVKILAL